MNLATLRDEVGSRGFEYLDTARLTNFVGRAYYMLTDAEPWPFLQSTTTGAAPLTIADLRSILYVVDSANDNVLNAIDERTVRDLDPTLSATGTPDGWYLQNNTVVTYPPSTVDLEVRYVSVPAELVDDTDEPVVPPRYHNLIVDGAVILAYKDTDEFENAANLRALYDDEVVSMREKLMDRNLNSNQQVQRTGSFFDANC